MGNDTKVVAHEGMDTSMGISYKCGYGDGHYSTLPIGFYGFAYLRTLQRDI